MRSSVLLLTVLAVLALACADLSAWGLSGRTAQLVLAATAGAALVLGRCEARA